MEKVKEEVQDQLLGLLKKVKTFENTDITLNLLNKVAEIVSKLK